MRIMIGDAKQRLQEIEAGTVDCCVTSPPYFGLRNYGTPGEIGAEQTPKEYIDNLVTIFSLVGDALKPDGTLWVNVGDSYASSGGKSQPHRDSSGGVGRKGTRGQRGYAASGGGFERPSTIGGGIKSKDLIGIPWMLAFALRNDGWYLRQDLIWHKPNPMPESVTDRCVRAHEYFFLLSKSERYYHQTIKEPATYAGQPRGGSKKRYEQNAAGCDSKVYDTRTKRSVWSVRPSNSRMKGQKRHFAKFPPGLIEPAILASSRPGGIVLDPFAGSGTTGKVAELHGRQAIMIELNGDYEPLMREPL